MKLRLARALVVSAMALPALGLDIPPALTSHETKVRVKLTPAQSQHLAGLAARLSPKMRASDVVVLAKGEPADSIFLLMMDYMKIMQKESRDNARLERELRQMTQVAKASKLAQDNKAIDDQMREAEEKASNLMNAATSELTLGVASGVQTKTQTALGIRTAPTPTPTHAPSVPGAARK